MQKLMDLKPCIHLKFDRSVPCLKGVKFAEVSVSHRIEISRLATVEFYTGLICHGEGINKNSSIMNKTSSVA